MRDRDILVSLVRHLLKFISRFVINWISNKRRPVDSEKTCFWQDVCLLCKPDLVIRHPHLRCQGQRLTPEEWSVLIWFLVMLMVYVIWLHGLPAESAIIWRCLTDFFPVPKNWTPSPQQRFHPLGTSVLDQCFSTFVRPRPGKFFFYKTRARSQQIVGLQTIFMTGHKQRYSLSRMLKDFDVWKLPIIHEHVHV
jgi:hypothetical protein